MKQTQEEGVFSESSEDDFINDSPKLQRTNAKRFGKVSALTLFMSLNTYTVILFVRMLDLAYFLTMYVCTNF